MIQTQIQVPKFIRDNATAVLNPGHGYSCFNLLYSNYDARCIRVNDRGYKKEYLIGRGSLTVLRCITDHVLDENWEPILRVGRMCDFARDTTLLIDGEHLNHKVINDAFPAFSYERNIFRQQKRMDMPLTTKGTTEIGSNVILSRGASVLSGVKIGDGAVVGANAVVTKDVPPYAIVAGNPAKVIRFRFDEKTIEKLQQIRWWDFEHNVLFSGLYEMQCMETDEFIETFQDISKNQYMPSGSRFVFQVLDDKGQIKCIGCDLEGRFVAYNDLYPAIRFYIDQALHARNNPIYMVSNILDCRDA